MHLPPRPLAGLACLLLASACSIATDYRIADGTKTRRGYTSVAGAVHIGRDAVVHGARTVAGEITVGDGARTKSLSTVAGGIRIGRHADIDGDVSTVAGAIRIADGTRVSGRVSSVAGAIDLEACRIDGRLEVSKGSVDISGPAQLPRGILVSYTSHGETDHPARIDIGAGAEVASIEVEPKARVDLRISRAARVGPIAGATPDYY